MRNKVTEIDSEGLVNVPGAFVALGHERLHELEFLRQRHVLRRCDPGRSQEVAHGLLGKILRAYAVIAGPFVADRLRIVIHGHEGEFVEPRGDVAVRGYVTGGSARAERDAEHGVFTQCH